MPRSPKLVEIRTGVDSGGRWNQQQTISGEDLGMVALTVGQVIGVFLRNCSGDCLLDSGSSDIGFLGDPTPAFSTADAYQSKPLLGNNQRHQPGPPNSIPYHPYP